MRQTPLPSFLQATSALALLLNCHANPAPGVAPTQPLANAAASTAAKALDKSPGRSPRGGLETFAAEADIGAVQVPGETQYDPRTQTYTVTGSGANMWSSTDAFHYAFTQLRGDFIVRARVRILSEGHESRKVGWTVRRSLDPQAMHVNATVHGNGLVDLQYRPQFGAETLQATPEIRSADVLQLERRGNTYIFSAAQFGQPFVTSQVEDIDLGQVPYVGLAVCSHDASSPIRAEFSNVRIVRPAGPTLRPYRDYLGSNLEWLDIETGHREILLRDPDSVQAPNWTADGKTLIFNRQGRLYHFDLASRRARLIDTGFAVDNNNDHVLSWDGTQLGISHHVQDDNRQSTLFTLPIAGFPPATGDAARPLRPITQRGGGHSFLHGFSPDDRKLIFTGERKGQFDIWTVDIDSGLETQLTDLPTLDDGAEYSRDGQYVYFNSARTGSMEIWRMRADGSEQTALTADEYNNWFPHVSPDGQSLIMLSFQKDVVADQHPFYQHVYLRTMPIAGGPASIVAYVYGGQGTINVPSWSPDGSKVAFVSNTEWLP